MIAAFFFGVAAVNRLLFVMRFSILILIILLLAQCSSKVTTSGTAAGDKYSEDLSSLRSLAITPADTTASSTQTTTGDAERDPSVYVEARHAVNTKLDMVLDSIDQQNVNRGVINGFTIQLYSGMSREEALDVKKQITTALPDLDSDVQFVQPNFRVRAGKYVNRYEAHKDFMAVKRLFPTAVIIPDRIPIR